MLMCLGVILWLALMAGAAVAVAAVDSTAS